jgi:hypothetical protein
MVARRAVHLQENFNPAASHQTLGGGDDFMVAGLICSNCPMTIARAATILPAQSRPIPRFGSRGKPLIMAPATADGLWKTFN